RPVAGKAHEPHRGTRAGWSGGTDERVNPADRQVIAGTLVRRRTDRAVTIRRGLTHSPQPLSPHGAYSMRVAGGRSVLVTRTAAAVPLPLTAGRDGGRVGVAGWLGVQPAGSVPVRGPDGGQRRVGAGGGLW